MKFVLVPELRNRWSWELRQKDGVLLATSAMSFANRERTVADIHQFRGTAAQACLVDEQGNDLEHPHAGPADAAYKSRLPHGPDDAKFVLHREPTAALWHWVMKADGGSCVARSGQGSRALDELLKSVRAVRAGAASTLVFDVLGRLQEGV